MDILGRNTGNEIEPTVKAAVIWSSYIQIPVSVIVYITMLYYINKNKDFDKPAKLFYNSMILTYIPIIIIPQIVNVSELWYIYQIANFILIITNILNLYFFSRYIKWYKKNKGGVNKFVHVYMHLYLVYSIISILTYPYILNDGKKRYEEYREDQIHREKLLSQKDYRKYREDHKDKIRMEDLENLGFSEQKE